MAENSLFYEAIDAIRQGERVRARDLLTRLITHDPTNAEYWVWISSVSDHPDERITCLRQALRLDPNNADARSQLEQMGVPLPDGPASKLATDEDRGSIRVEQSKPSQSRFSLPFLNKQHKVTVLGIWAIALVLVGVGFSVGMGRRDHRPLIMPGTAKPSATFLPTTTLVVRSPTPTFTGPTPLWMFLEATYTPTPIYVNTPHPRSEAYRVGLQKYLQGDLGGLITYMEQVVFNEPDAVDAMVYAGEGYRLLGEAEKALSYYDQALVINPGFAPAYLGRARARFDLDPQTPVQEDIEQALSIDPNLVEGYLFAANVALSRGDTTHAFERLSQVEAVSRESAVFYLLRAQAYLQDGQVELALQDAREANRLDLTMLPGYRLLGQVLQAHDELEASIDPLQTYLRYTERDAEGWVWLAEAQHSLPDDAAALDSLNRAIEVDPKLAEAYLLRGIIYLDEAQDVNDKETAMRALDEFTQATYFEADPYRLAIGKGRAYLILDMPDPAARYFDRAWTFAGDDAQEAVVFYWRAQAYAALDQPDAELLDWQALLGLPEDTVPAEWREQAQKRLENP